MGPYFFATGAFFGIILMRWIFFHWLKLSEPLSMNLDIRYTLSVLRFTNPNPAFEVFFVKLVDKRYGLFYIYIS